MKPKTKQLGSIRPLAIGGLDWRIAVTRIDPEVAARMLASTHETQRKLKPRVVKQYVGDMLGDLFKLTPEPIIVSRAGYLIDGQHRLTAVVESGVTCEFLVVSNVHEATMPWINIGKSRTVLDVARIAGVEVGPKDLAVSTCLGTLDRMQIRAGLTRWEQLEQAGRYEVEIEFARALPSIKVDGRRVISAVPAALAWMGSPLPDASIYVAKQLAVGEWINCKDPIFHLWKYLSGSSYENDRKTELGRIVVMAKTIKVVRAIEEGAEMKHLKTSASAMHREWTGKGFRLVGRVCGRSNCKLPSGALGLCLVHRAFVETSKARSGR